MATKLQRSIVGTEGDDTLLGTFLPEFIDALGGDDKVFAKGGNDTVLGGEGDDWLYGQNGNDVLIGNTGSDRFFGGWGRDRMIWNNGDGSDLMEGGAGFDTTVVNGAGGAGDVFTIAANGDRVAFDRVNLVPFNLDIGTTEQLVVNGGGGDDVIEAGDGLAGLIRLRLNGGAGNDEVIGGDGNDVLTGGSGDDLLVGRRGDDKMFGGSGNDRLVWNNGDGSDLMEGGRGYDVVEVNGSDGSGDVFTIVADGDRVAFDRVNLGPFSLDIGTTEKLEVNGLGGDDVIEAENGLAGLIKLDLDGGAGNDTIIGGDGDDRINGGEGDDVLTGGAGADVFVFNTGLDVITDFDASEDRILIVDQPGVENFADVLAEASQEGDDVIIDFGTDEITLQDVQLDLLDAGNFLFA